VVLFKFSENKKHLLQKKKENFENLFKPDFQNLIEVQGWSRWR
jgi:hypothetical protein